MFHERHAGCLLYYNTGVSRGGDDENASVSSLMEIARDGIRFLTFVNSEKGGGLIALSTLALVPKAAAKAMLRWLIDADMRTWRDPPFVDFEA